MYTCYLLLFFTSVLGQQNILSPSAPQPYRKSLHKEGLHYTISLNVGGISFPRFLLDTASSDLILRTDFAPYSKRKFQTTDKNPPGNWFPKKLLDTVEHNLYVDNRVISYKFLSTSKADVSIETTRTTTTTTTTTTATITTTNIATTPLNHTVVLADSVSLDEDDWTVLTSSWQNSSGVLGIGFPTQSDTFTKSTNLTTENIESKDPGKIRNNTWSGLLLETISPDLLAFALDFDGDSVSNNQPTLWMGGVPKSYRSKLTWAEYSPARPPLLVGTYNDMFINATQALINNNIPTYQNPNSYYRFRMHDLNVCNVSLIRNVSDAWPVLLDSGAACLMLPSNLFDSVINWLGSSVKEFGKDVWILNTQRNKLPTLSFALEQKISNQKVPRERMYVPLESLIYQRNKWMPPELCMLRSTQRSDLQLSGLTFQQTSKIVFGSMVMKNFFIGIDMANGRMALSNTKNAKIMVENSKRFNSIASSRSCSKKTVCIGQQIYFAPSNQCLKPNCNAFLFRTLDSHTYYCVWDTGIMAGWLIAIVALVLVELNSSIGYHMFVKTIQTREMYTTRNNTRRRNSTTNNNNDTDSENNDDTSSSEDPDTEDEDERPFPYNDQFARQPSL